MTLGRILGYSCYGACGQSAQNYLFHPRLNKAVLPPYVSSVLMAHYGVSISSLPSLQENSLGMDGAIYIAAALSENRGLRHIK